MEVSEIIKLFHDEFGITHEKFVVIDIAFLEAKKSEADYIWHLGVYVFWLFSKVIKVGCSLKNSRNRAPNHIRDNTGGIMEELGKDPKLKLLLFKNPADVH